MPPDMNFKCPMWHPNSKCIQVKILVHKETGKVCISILHPPGVDPHNQGEQAADRWRPIHTVESIIVSVQSMLMDPNCDSPENVDASIMFKKDREAFNKKVRRCAQDSINYL